MLSWELGRLAEPISDLWNGRLARAGEALCGRPSAAALARLSESRAWMRTAARASTRRTAAFSAVSSSTWTAAIGSAERRL